MKRNSFILSTLLSGLAVSILSILDLTAMVNLLFCGWVWLGVFFAVTHYNRLNHHEPMATPMQGAVIGMTTGIISAAVYSVLSYYKLLAFDMMELIDTLANSFDVPTEEVLAMLPEWNMDLLTTLTLMNFLVFLGLFILIGAVGGSVTAVIAGRRKLMLFNNIDKPINQDDDPGNDEK